MQTRANAIVISLAIAAGIVSACESKSISGLGPSPTGPVVAGVFPQSGPTDGSTEMQITGSRFQAGLTVTLGGSPMEVLASNSTTIQARTPAHIAGIVDLVVTNPDGMSTTRRSAYTYVPFEVTGINPGTALPGSAVAIVGTGFQPGATVTFGDRFAIGIFVTGTRILVEAPAHAAGAVDVVVINPGGVRRTVSGGFVYEIVALVAEPEVVAPGETLSVTWSAPSGRSTFDWIGFFKVGEPSTNYASRWWEYTEGGASGTRQLSAPMETGQYEFRYLPNDGFIDAGRSAPVTVVVR